MRFWLGVHQPNWMSQTDVGLMLSRNRLTRYKTLPVSAGPWVLDSGAFTEIKKYGRWTITSDEYVECVQRYAEEIKQLVWAAPQDWMCEPFMVEHTGLSVREHQERTVANYLELRERGPFIPVLQGWERDEYETHVAMYMSAGIDLRDLPVVGIGSVCRRAATEEIVELVTDLVNYGISLHGFGVKRQALTRVGWAFTSADSMAWSYGARRNPPLPGCTHPSCQNCLKYALKWRAETLEKVNLDDRMAA